MANPNIPALRLVGGQLLEARRAALGARAPHSLEPVSTVDGVDYINDSRATFLDAALASLGQMERPVVWIAGAWSDDMSEGHVVELMHERVRAVVLFGPLMDVVPPQGVELIQANELRTA